RSRRSACCRRKASTASWNAPSRRRRSVRRNSPAGNCRELHAAVRRQAFEVPEASSVPPGSTFRSRPTAKQITKPLPKKKPRFPGDFSLRFLLATASWSLERHDLAVRLAPAVHLDGVHGLRGRGCLDLDRARGGGHLAAAEQ